MTAAAERFVTPLTLAVLSGNTVYDDMWGNGRSPAVEHIALADRADVAVIAPATANTIGKLSNGLADNMLTTVFMAATCPVLVCPSMNVNMYRHPVTQRNLKRLEKIGYHVMAPEAGDLACGWTGEGRMPEPFAIVEEIERLLIKPDLSGVRALVTAGPTEEPIDPVRFISNRSSGKMGVAIARRARLRGAEVTLIAGPLKVPPPAGVRHLPVRTAQEMHSRVMEIFPDVDVVIKSAAVADFRPSRPAGEKIKKSRMNPSVDLIRNPDILQELGRRKRRDQILVGFAAETEDIIQNARKKLHGKNLDMLVVNDVSRPGAGFDHDTNIVRFLHRSGEDEEFELMTKEAVADVLLDRVKALRGPPIVGSGRISGAAAENES